ncbi:MAG: TlpA disulfide reductase family protein [Bacteroidetes bacterium]|nr:TlpA disulfide reductase family protein [Bacteroidota bacterium]
MKQLLFILAFSMPIFLSAQESEDSTIIWQQNHYQDTLAPRFSLIDINGNLWSSDSLLGKTIVLNFWSIHCPGCFQELPELNNIPSQFSKDSVVFISVLFEKSPKTDSVMAKNHFNYHIVLDGLQIQSDFYNNCFPTHIIIDRNGMIRYNVCGVVNEAILVPEINKIDKR